MNAPSFEDTLEHYGVKGMKWGTRRSKRELAKAREQAKSDDYKTAEGAKAKATEKGLSSLSNKELETLNRRLNLEQQYVQLTTKESSRKKSAGKKYAQDLLLDVGNQQAKQYLNRQVGEMIKKSVG